MTNPTQLKPTTLLAVGVSENIKPIVIDNVIKHFGKPNIVCSRTENNTVDLDWIYLPEGYSYEILGTCTAEEISFDVSEYLDVIDKVNGRKIYECYEGIVNGTDIPNEAFRSLLSANDLHFVNSYGEKPLKKSYARNSNGQGWYSKHFEDWQTAENNLVKKLLIIKRIT